METLQEALTGTFGVYIIPRIARVVIPGLPHPVTYAPNSILALKMRVVTVSWNETISLLSMVSHAQ